MSVPAMRAAVRTAPLLTVERLRAVLDACGYHCVASSPAGNHSLSPGCSVVLQFGDLIARNADGVERLTLRSSLRLNDGAECRSGVTYWQIQKLVHLPVGSDQLCLAVEADLLLGDGVELADVLAEGSEAHRHLRMLVDDVCGTLDQLAVDDRPGRKADDPVVRIEAKFVAGHATGRSGFLPSDQRAYLPFRRTTSRHLLMMRAVCDWLRDDPLPKLVGALRRLHPEADSAATYPLQVDAGSGLESVRSRSDAWLPTEATPRTGDAVTLARQRVH
ncbi:hypothetical protein [Bradyrhizobium genosp. A]|uniref:hypothetical protein n=1 Tax=Bradyrhizobium genosp. A TaxID=83626 RepID=UPI003CF2534B